MQKVTQCGIYVGVSLNNREEARCLGTYKVFIGGGLEMGGGGLTDLLI